ncbi:hypothetical protein NKG94_14090 [Micromonospora sp. M12]
MAIEGFLAATYDPRLRIHSRNGYRLTHHRVDAGPFAIATTRQTGHLDIAASTLDGLVIGRSRSARVDRACAGSAHRFGPGEVFLVSRPEEPCGVRWHPGEVELCVLDLSLLAQVATTAPGRRPVGSSSPTWVPPTHSSPGSGTTPPPSSATWW